MTFKKSIFIVFIIIVIKCCSISVGLPLPFDEFSYISARNQLRLEDEGTSNALLSNKEKVVSFYFEKVKDDEFTRLGLYNFAPARPIESELDDIQSSFVYSVLRQMPKGGNIHIHENQMLDRLLLLKIVQSSTEWDYLYMCDPNKPVSKADPSPCPCVQSLSSYYLT
jgi:hypothetical protein